jgi:D-glycero-D-manno-heptose 1,7-bisphosphate phosphatase
MTAGPVRGRPAVFLDLNGTLVLPVRADHPRDYTLIPGVPDALRRLRAHGFACPVVTVQTRIARGRYSLPAFVAWFRDLQAGLRAQGAELLGPYVCPHGTRDGCPCQKPAPLLYERAAAELGLDVPRSVVVGDTTADLRAARAVGCPGVLVRTGWGEGTLGNPEAGPLATAVVADLPAAAEWILRHLPPAPA